VPAIVVVRSVFLSIPINFVHKDNIVLSFSKAILPENSENEIDLVVVSRAQKFTSFIISYKFVYVQPPTNPLILIDLSLQAFSSNDGDATHR